jgi:DNA-binding response OmpR family regulator
VEDQRAASTILVADDEADIIALVCRRLAKAGFEVITAVNGEQALQMARDRMPDLALLDAMMPKLSGIEVSRQLRSAPETHAMPVILMSAGPFDTLTIPEVADAFISKPFRGMDLPALVGEVLARTGRVSLIREPG